MCEIIALQNSSEICQAQCCLIFMHLPLLMCVCVFCNKTSLVLRFYCATPFCTSFALHRKATPDCRQEGNQYCTNQYNIQYLAILSEESI